MGLARRAKVPREHISFGPQAFGVGRPAHPVIVARGQDALVHLLLDERHHLGVGDRTTFGLTSTKTHDAARDVLAVGVLLRRRSHLDRLGVLDGRQSRP